MRGRTGLPDRETWRGRRSGRPVHEDGGAELDAVEAFGRVLLEEDWCPRKLNEQQQVGTGARRIIARARDVALEKHPRFSAGVLPVHAFTA